MRNAYCVGAKFGQYGIGAEGITLPEGQGTPDGHMFREAVRQIKAARQ
jgi:hypothetical protein